MTHSRTSSRRTVTAAAAGGLGLTLVATAALIGPASATPSGKVTLCHATSSARNPYVLVTVNTSAVLERNHGTPNGHATHTGPVFDPQGGQHQRAWGDIIPAFVGSPGFGGLNLSEAGLAILAHGCTLPTPSPTPTESESHHATPSPTPTESESHHVTPSPTESDDHCTGTPTPTPTETTPDPTPTETTPDPTPTETTPDPTPTETTPDPTPSEPTQDPGTPTDAPTSTPDPSPSTTTSEDPNLPSTGGRTTGLPQTGSSSSLLALLGAGLLGVGGVTLLAGRRRPVLDAADTDDAIG